MSGQENVKDRIWVGDRILEVPALAPGERLVPVAELSELLVISPAAQQAAAEAVQRAEQAFVRLGSASDASISAFFGYFADLLEDAKVIAEIERANTADVESAKARGRATGRLVAAHARNRWSRIRGRWRTSSWSCARGSSHTLPSGRVGHRTRTTAADSRPCGGTATCRLTGAGDRLRA